MVRIAVLGLSLIVVGVEAGCAQDIAGIEDCTKTSGLDKQTGCLQSNVNFLQVAVPPREAAMQIARAGRGDVKPALSAQQRRPKSSRGARSSPHPGRVSMKRSCPAPWSPVTCAPTSLASDLADARSCGFDLLYRG
jgi:hypothetical protein